MLGVKTIRHGGGIKTTIPTNPAFDYTYANENILSKVKKVMFGGKMLISPEKSSLVKQLKCILQ